MNSLAHDLRGTQVPLSDRVEAIRVAFDGLDETDAMAVTNVSSRMIERGIEGFGYAMGKEVLACCGVLLANATDEQIVQLMSDIAAHKKRL